MTIQLGPRASRPGLQCYLLLAQEVTRGSRASRPGFQCYLLLPWTLPQGKKILPRFEDVNVNIKRLPQGDLPLFQLDWKLFDFFGKQDPTASSLLPLLWQPFLEHPSVECHWNRRPWSSSLVQPTATCSSSSRSLCRFSTTEKIHGPRQPTWGQCSPASSYLSLILYLLMRGLLGPILTSKDHLDIYGNIIMIIWIQN